MPGFQGAETAQLRAAGDAADGGAAQLADLSTRLGTLIEAVPWAGRDAEAFRADWSGRVLPDLQRCEQRLSADARALHAHAEEQDACSAPDTLGAAGPGPGGAPEPGGAPGPGGVPDAIGLGSVGLPELRLMHVSTTLPGAAPPPGGVPSPQGAADVSDAIGTDGLLFDDTGMRLNPPEAEATVTVGEDHQLAPGDHEQPFGLDADGEPLALAPSTRYEVGAHGTYYTDAEGQVVYVEATGGGEEMNPNLREVFPETTYHVNDSTFYRTDELGRTEHMYVPEVIVDRDMARSQSIQSKIAERWDMVGDDSSEPVEFNAGHVLARQLGGIREEINYTRQWDEVNQARSGKDTIYTFEDLMAEGITEHDGSFTYETRVTWGEEQPAGVGPEHGSEPWEYVPESYDVRVDQDGERIVDAHLENYPEGARFPD